MMKKTNKFLALLLAVVMVFAMSVSAFATPVETATVRVIYGGEYLLNATENLTPGMTAFDMLEAHRPELELVWKQVPNLNPDFPSIAKAVDTIYGIGSEPVGVASGITAQFWSSAYPGYGVESMTVAGGTTTYHYIYVGNDWQFTVNNEIKVDPNHPDYQLYMDQYEVQNGDVVVIDYVEQVVRWDVPENEHWLTA